MLEGLHAVRPVLVITRLASVVHVTCLRHEKPLPPLQPPSSLDRSVANLAQGLHAVRPVLMAETLGEPVPGQRQWAEGDKGEWYSTTHGVWFSCRITHCRAEDGDARGRVPKCSFVPAPWASRRPTSPSTRLLPTMMGKFSSDVTIGAHEHGK